MMTAKRDCKGRFKKDDCPLKQFKESVKNWSDRHDDGIAFAIALFILWMIFTGFCWALWEKSTVVSTCENVPRCDGWYTYYPISNETRDYCNTTVERCNDHTVKSYYSLPEIVGIQVGFCSDVIEGVIDFGKWMSKHPVI
jgi:hypothetical protein